MCVKSLLDTDLYKFTTSYAYMKMFPDAEGTFEFNDRKGIKYDDRFIEMLRTELQNLGSLRLQRFELDYVTSDIRFIPRFYWEWLSGFSFNPNKINACLDKQNHLQISVTDKLYKVTLYEVPILAIVSQITNEWRGNKVDWDKFKEDLDDKIFISNSNRLPFSEFGTRRRFNFYVQDTVCERLVKTSQYCNGTSNVFFAMRHGLKPIGTHPHEWFMFHGAQFGYKQANYLALENWVNVYDGDLGIALSDTYTSDVFLKNFSRKHAKLFDGVRHDSGDPYKFTDKVISRYKELGIDPITKTIIFSDGLDFFKFRSIFGYCKNKIKAAAGIGTNLTNDCGHEACNIVMKLTKCRMNERQPWCDCIKLSDVSGKHMGNPKEIEICKYQCNIN